MRLIMAKLLWTFDLELDPKSQDWIQGCKVFTLWDKPELLVKLTQVDRGWLSTFERREEVRKGG